MLADYRRRNQDSGPLDEGAGAASSSESPAGAGSAAPSSIAPSGSLSTSRARRPELRERLNHSRRASFDDDLHEWVNQRMYYPAYVPITHSPYRE